MEEQTSQDAKQQGLKSMSESDAIRAKIISGELKVGTIYDEIGRASCRERV